MADPARFWDFIAKRYSRQPVADEATYQKKLQTTRQYFDRESEVLKFGCGTGTTALIHAPYFGHIRAIDFSRRMIEIAEAKRVAAQAENVRFESKDIRDYEPDGRRYDVVLGLSVLHLLPDWRQVIFKVAGLLKPGGVFISSTACIGDSMKWFSLIARVGRTLRVLPELEVFTTRELEQGIRDAGLIIEHKWQPGKNKAVFIVARNSA